MPVIYPKSIRRKFASINLEKVKKSLENKGYKFIRDGGFRAEDKPFKYCNYLFYKHPQTQTAIRIGYDYPLLCNENRIFEICYATPDIRYWVDVTPDFRKSDWKEVSDWYKRNEKDNYVKI